MGLVFVALANGVDEGDVYEDLREMSYRSSAADSRGRAWENVVTKQEVELTVVIMHIPEGSEFPLRLWHPSLTDFERMSSTVRL